MAGFICENVTRVRHFPFVISTPNFEIASLIEHATERLSVFVVVKAPDRLILCVDGID